MMTGNDDEREELIELVHEVNRRASPAARQFQTAPATTQALWPPKPKLLEIAAHRGLAGGVRDVVQVALRVGVLQIDGRVNRAVLMDRATRSVPRRRWPPTVADHALGAADRQLACGPNVALIALVSATSPRSVRQR